MITSTVKYVATPSVPTACKGALTDYYLFKVNANDVVQGYFKPIKTDYFD